MGEEDATLHGFLTRRANLSETKEKAKKKEVYAEVTVVVLRAVSLKSEDEVPLWSLH